MIRHKRRQINIVLHEEKINHHKHTNRSFSYIDEQLSSFVGLNHMKKTVKEIYATLLVNKKREELGLMKSKQVLHMMFKDNKGTGKTTNARKKTNHNDDKG